VKKNYRQWLENQKYDTGTISAQMYRAERVETYHGDLDEHYARDHKAGLIDTLRYSTDFDRKAKAAARIVPNLVLRKYSVQFLFSDVSLSGTVPSTV